MTTILETLSHWSASQALLPLRDDVRHHAKRAVLDWFAAIYPGTLEPVSQRLATTMQDEALGRCRLPGFGWTAGPATAAWINGTASHAIEFDDIFKDAIYHPGVPTIAAALAMGDHLNATGEAFLRAVVVGYEISTRIGVAVQPSHYQYFHTTGTIGCFGAAAAAAYLLAPGDPRVMAHALASAASFASGLQQAFRSDAMTKALHGGHAAHIGVVAAKAAHAGVTGALDILEGKAGFGAAMSQTVEWGKVTVGLGDQFNITRMTQKAHGCCGHTFAAIDAMLILRAELTDLERQSVQRIEVDTYAVAIEVAGQLEPVSAYQAKFSLPYVLIQALRYGSVRLEAFSPRRLQDPDTRAAMALVTMRTCPQMSDRFPGARSARVRITLADGRQLEHFAPCRRGDPEAPLSDQELESKFAELATPVLGKEKADRLRGAIANLESLSLSELPV